MQAPSSPLLAPDHLGSQYRLSDSALRISTPDLQDAGASVGGMHSTFRGKLSAVTRSLQPMQVHSADCGNVGVSMWRYGREMRVDPEDLGKSLMVITVLQGRMALAVDGGPSGGGGAGTTVLVSSTQRPRFYYSAEAEVLKLRLDRHRIETVCWRILGRQGRVPLQFGDPMQEPNATFRWHSLLAYVASLAGAGLANAQRDLIGPGLEEMLATELLIAQPHNYSDALRSNSAGVLPTQCRRALAFIDANLEQSITAADIATAAGCSVRSLSRAFALFLSTSPMQHLRQRRVERAHAAFLQASDPDESVAAVALRCGFGHQGEFNRTYRARFGESPSQTRRRASSA